MCNILFFFIFALMLQTMQVVLTGNIFLSAMTRKRTPKDCLHNPKGFFVCDSRVAVQTYPRFDSETNKYASSYDYCNTKSVCSVKTHIIRPDKLSMVLPQTGRGNLIGTIARTNFVCKKMLVNLIYNISGIKVTMNKT
jgi:hypothetical protein